MYDAVHWEAAIEEISVDENPNEEEAAAPNNYDAIESAPIVPTSETKSQKRRYIACDQ